MQRATLSEITDAIGTDPTSARAVMDCLADKGMRIVHVDAKVLRPGDEGHPATQVERAVLPGAPRDFPPGAPRARRIVNDPGLAEFGLEGSAEVE